MKKNLIYIVIMTIACCISSCSDVINIYPVENNTADQFYSSEYEIQQAVMGIYARLGRNGTNTDYPTDIYYQASESRSDNLYYAVLANAQRDQVDMRNFQVTDVTNLNTNIYARLYQIINDANTLLQNAPEQYKRLRAEACFLRALAYFDLVRAYGPQPVLDHPISNQEAKKMEREPIENVYTQIISDLEFAGNNLEPFYYGDDAGRVGSIAAKCLLGEVYVTMAGYPLYENNGYQKAEQVLAPIMNIVQQRFAPNFSFIFDVNKENTYDIFSIQFASGNQGLGSSLPAFITSGSGSITTFPEWVYGEYSQQGQDFRVDTLLVQQMEQEGDKRLETAVAKGFWTNLKHGFTPQDSILYYERRCIMIKFLVKDNTNNIIKAWNDYPLNFPILRPADAYLLYAEALVNNNKAGEAAKWINEVRKRAGLSSLKHNPTMEDIMYERRCEFLGEGKRYFDLVRMGKETFVSTLKAFSDHYQHVALMGASNPSEKDMLLPIPLTVMNIHTSWVNNPGY
jgi:hypothetical protein